jgi:ABC-type ATPase involved in cell division
VLRLQQVSLRIDDTVVLDAVTAAFKAGELTVVEGPRGAGKTTLLEIAGTRRRPDSGQIWIAGHDITALQRRSLPFVRRNIGFSSAVPRFLSGLTVLENVMLPLGARAEPAAWAREAALRALGRVGVVGLALREPGTLSVSARRLVGIARALAGPPPLVLLDDPGASLAPGDFDAIWSALFACAESGAAVVCASADPAFSAAAVRAGGRRLRLEAGRLAAEPHAVSPALSAAVSTIGGRRSGLRLAIGGGAP